MPELSRFYGIVIKMYFADHGPPHFHAEYAGTEALISIETLATFAGGLPPQALTCISHHPTVEAHDTTAMTSLRLLAVLNVLFKYACARQAAHASS